MPRNGPWPVWLPGQELRACDLHGLEDYVLSPYRLLLQRGHGVDWLRQDSIRLLQDPDTKRSRFEVRNVRGVTRGGYPVELTESCPVLSEPLEDVMARHDVFIALEDKAENKGEGQGITEGRAEKLRVRFTANKGHEPLQHEPDQLFLGTVECRSGKTKWYRRPFVYRLEALRELEGWQEWVEPLCGQLLALVKKPFFGSQSEVVRYAYGAHLLYLTFHWAVMPIVDLIGAIAYLQSLRSTDPGSWLLTQKVSPWFAPDMSEWTGDEAPKLLAQRLRELQPPEGNVELEPGIDYERGDFADGMFVVLRLTDAGLSKIRTFAPTNLELELREDPKAIPRLLCKKHKPVPFTGEKVPGVAHTYRFQAVSLLEYPRDRHEFSGPTFKESLAPRLSLVKKHAQD